MRIRVTLCFKGTRGNEEFEFYRFKFHFGHLAPQESHWRVSNEVTSRTRYGSSYRKRLYVTGNFNNFKAVEKFVNKAANEGLILESKREKLIEKNKVAKEEP